MRMSWSSTRFQIAIGSSSAGYQKPTARNPSSSSPKKTITLPIAIAERLRILRAKGGPEQDPDGSYEGARESVKDDALVRR